MRWYYLFVLSIVAVANVAVPIFKFKRSRSELLGHSIAELLTVELINFAINYFLSIFSASATVSKAIDNASPKSESALDRGIVT